MLTAIFLGDPSVGAPSHNFQANTQTELTQLVTDWSAQQNINPANWFGDGYQDVSGITYDPNNAWVWDALGIEAPSGWDPNAGGGNGGNGGNNNPPPPEEPSWETVTPENQATPEQIRQLYRQYAGYSDEEIDSMGIIEYHTQTHPITYDDLLNWAQTAPEVQASLEEHQALAEEEQQRYDEGLAIINDSDLSNDQKEAWKIIYDNYDGDTVNEQQILDAFETAKTNTLDPYWAGLLDLAEQDFINQLDTLSGKRERELETEGIAEEQRLSGAQASLESRGMTFSGESVEQLGTRSGVGTAYGEEGTGLLGQQSRLISTASAAEHARLTQEIGIGIEGQLGSGALGQFNIPGYTQVGTSQGSLPTEQNQVYGNYLNQLLRNAYGVAQYNQNQQL